MPRPTAQGQYYIAQKWRSNQQNNQQFHWLWNCQSSSQPVSSSSNLQSRQMPQVSFSDLQNPLLLRNSTLMRSSLPNRQFGPLLAAPHGTPTQNLSRHPQTLNRNTVPQQNHNMPPLHSVSSTSTGSCFPLVDSNAGSATDQNNLTHHSVLPQYQSLNGPHNRMQIAHQPASRLQQPDLSVQSLPNQAPQKIHGNQCQISGGKGNGALYSSVNQFPVASQRLITPSQPSNYSHQTGQPSSQIQHQPSPYGMGNNSDSSSHLKHSRNQHQSLSNLPHPLSYTRQNFIVQRQPDQRINQSLSLSLPQDNVQPQTPLQKYNTILVSGNHSKTCHPTVPAIQGKTQPQILQSSSTPISEAPPPSYRESTRNYSQLMDFLVAKGNTQVLAQRHGTSPMSCHNTSFTTQGQTPSHITTKASYSTLMNLQQIPESAPYCSVPAALRRKELQRVSEYQTAVRRTEDEHVLGNQLKAPDVQSFEGMENRKLQTDSNTKGTDECKGNNRYGEVQYCEDVAESLELVLALQKVLRQSYKAVAVVPPISQQTPSPEKNDHENTSPDDSLPFKISAVCTLVKEGKNVEQESNAQSLPKETIEELLQLSVPDPEMQELDKHEDGSIVDSLISDTQSTDIPQSKTGSTTSQGPVCSTVLTSKCPEDHKVKTGKSNGNVVDLSKVQVLRFTQEKFHNWVKLLEVPPEGSVKEPVADVKECLLDLFWNGNTENLVKQMNIFPAYISDFFSKVSIKEVQTAIFQYIQPKDLKMLEDGYHILKNDTDFPTEEFRSSWLNIDEQPADIEKVLAEQNMDFTDYTLYRNFSTINIYSEFESSTKVIPAQTDCQIDKMINKELANSQVCESKPTEQVSNTQEASEKQEDENLEKHQQQDVNLNPEESADSKEMDTLNESKSKTECEQVCRDASEDITSSVELVEQRDLCTDDDDDDSSNDFQLIELSLLSSDDARIIFKEYSGCDLQKEPSQLCQDATKASATRDHESSNFCKSANRIKFTCPHVTGINWDGDHFCPRCWEQTPLLHLDLEEALLSPTGGSPEFGKPDSNCTVLSESSSIADSPTPVVDVFEVTMSEPDPYASDAVESCTSLSGKSPVKEPQASIRTETVSFTVPVDKQVYETSSSMGAELPKPLSCAQNLENLKILKQTKTPKDEVSPPCKKLKLTKTTEMPAEDDLFTTDLVTKKANSTKPHPSDFNVTPAEYGQNCKDERTEGGDESKSPIRLKIPVNTQCSQSGKPDPTMNVCSESSSDFSNPSTYGVNMSVTEPDPNLGDSEPSCSSQSSKSTDKEAHGQVCLENMTVIMPIEEQVCEANILSAAGLPKALSLTQNVEKRKPVILSQSKTLRKKVSPPRKKVNVTKATSIPAEDDLFTPDIVVKMASSTKPHPYNLNVTSPLSVCWPSSVEDSKSPIMLKTELDEHSGQTKTHPRGKLTKPSLKFQAPVVTPQPKKTAVVANSDTNKEKVLGTTKQTGQNKEMKKLQFALYGFNNTNRNRVIQSQDYNMTKLSTAPVYITVSNKPEISNSYTDALSAKQKVYSQWSSTFVETKKSTSSHKKCPKHVKKELKSRGHALKCLVKDRLAIKEKQFTDGAKRKQNVEDFVAPQEEKKFKCTISDENL